VLFRSASDVKYHAVAVDWVLARMDESGMDVKLLILDACRNNPLGRSLARTVTRGLAVMETPKGALIAYATSPGKTANDGAGRNSPFTARLLQELLVPGQPIELVFKAVRVGVQQETNGHQVPWEASSLIGEFVFSKSLPIDVQSQPEPDMGQPSIVTQIQDELVGGSEPVEIWEGTQGIWHVKAYIKNGRLKGWLQCYNEKLKTWSGRSPSFEAVLAEDGTFRALTQATRRSDGSAGWSERVVSGKFPEVQIYAIQPKVGCPNGKVALKMSKT